MFIAFPVCVYAQAQDYVQFGAGAGSSYHRFSVQGEYEKTFKWLDVGLSLDYESWNLPLGSEYWMSVQYEDNQDGTDWYNTVGKENIEGETLFALRLNVRVNLVRLFVADSRHALKIGGGIGYSRENNSSIIFSEVDEDFLVDTKIYDNFMPFKMNISNEICFKQR
jgi:hypothetical protein